MNKHKSSLCKLFLVILPWSESYCSYMSNQILLFQYDLFLNVELFIAFLCNHIHRTSIGFSSGDLVGKNTRTILGWWRLLIAFVVFFLPAYWVIILYNKDRLNARVISWINPSYEVYKLVTGLVSIRVSKNSIVSMIIDTKYIQKTFYLLCLSR